MRILVVSDGPLDHPLGNRRILTTTVKFFVRRGHEVGYYGPRMKGDLPPELEGVQFLYYVSPKVTLENMLKKLKFFPEASSYYSPTLNIHFANVLLKRSRWDLIYFIHLQGLSYSLIDIAHKSAIPAVMHVMDNFFFCNRSYNFVDHSGEICCRCVEYGFQSAIELGCTDLPPWLYDRARQKFASSLLKLSAIFFQSELHLDLFRTIFPGYNGHLETLDLPVDCREFQHSSSIGNYIVFNGPPTKIKGFYWFLDVASKSNWEFFVPLSSGKAPETYTYSPNIKLIPNCTFDKGLKDIIVGARCVAVPSLWDCPCETATIYPMLMGKLVITTDLGWNHINLKDGYNALLISPYKHASFEHALRKLDDEKLVSEIGNNARESCLKRFGEETWNQNVHRLLQRLRLSF